MFTDLENKDSWKECLRVEGVELPTGYYFGASASTGDLSDNHLLYSFKFYELESPPDTNAAERTKIIPKASSFEAPREHKEDPKPSSWSNVKIFFFILFGMLICCVLAIAGYMYYEKYQTNKKKRFY